MAKTRLGIDMGTNSIGWLLYKLDKNGEVSGILKTGVRIFADGREDKSYASKNAARRAARMMRRQRDRYIQRRTAILHYLVKFGLMPEDETERRKLQVIDPYHTRAKAMTDEIPLHHLGRAIFHISQKRGFESNRRTGNDKDGPVNNSVKQFRQQLGTQTVGQFLSQIHQNGKPVRARRTGAKAEDLYCYYPARDLIKEEFKSIWQKQRQFYTNELTDENLRVLSEVIFNQRNLKPPIIGNCQFFTKEKRAAKALSSFQRYRILCDINHLRYFDDNEQHGLPTSIRNWALHILFSGKNLTFDRLNKEMKKTGEINSDVVFNLADEKRKDIKGDFTAKTMDKLIPNLWKAWDMNTKDEVIKLLIDDSIKNEHCIEKLCNDYNLSEDDAQKCVTADVDMAQEVNGRASLSLKAINKLIPFLEKGSRYDEAVDESGISKKAEQTEDSLHSDLPPYPEVLGAWCLPRKTEDEANPKLWRIPNPTVHVALNQLRVVINDCIQRNGKPSQVVVELARDLPIGAKTRREIMSKQAENEKARKQRRNKIEELGIMASPNAMLRMQLWEESSPQNAANNRCCLYCNKKIGAAKAALSADFEIDHILPFSKTLDDSTANKILCCLKCNRDKGNQTPYEAWGADEERYGEIIKRALELPKNKRWRFLPEAMEDFQQNHKDFLARQLTDTQYIAKATRRYFEAIMPSKHVYVIPGRLTGMLRRKWGLNNILNEDGKKNRKDHRHHAIDAAVVGATTRATLQIFAAEAGKDNACLGKLHITEPMNDFRAQVEKAVKNIVVSHKPNRHPEGALHNDTAYRLPADFKENAGAQPVRHHIMLTDLNENASQKIVNSTLRKNLVALCESTTDKKSLKQELQRYGEIHNIRRVLIEETLSVIPVYDKTGKAYKGYKGDSNWAYDIFEKTPNGDWSGEIISTFNANKKGFIPAWKKENSDALCVMRLHINDMVALCENGQRVICYVRSISEMIITMTEHFDATPSRESETRRFKSPNALRKLNGRKIHVSPAGLIRDDKRDG